MSNVVVVVFVVDKTLVAACCFGGVMFYVCVCECVECVCLLLFVPSLLLFKKGVAVYVFIVLEVSRHQSMQSMVHVLQVPVCT